METTNQMLERAVAAKTNGAAAPAKSNGSALGQVLHKYQDEFAKVLSNIVPLDRFLRVCETKVKTNPFLYKCAVENPTSFASACLQMAQYNLDPAIPNEAHFVPRKNRKTGRYDISCDIGYKGLVKLAEEAAAQNGNSFVLLDAQPIHENDTYEREHGSNKYVKHVPPPFGKHRGDVVGFVAVAKDSRGRVQFEEMTVQDVKRHKKRFSKADKGPMADPENFPRYGCKTVLRLLITRHLSLSPKLARAVARDIENETGEQTEHLDALEVEFQEVQSEPQEEQEQPISFQLEEDHDANEIGDEEPW